MAFDHFAPRLRSAPFVGYSDSPERDAARHEDRQDFFAQQADADRARQEAADDNASRAVREAILAIPAWAFTAGVMADIAACLESRCKDLGPSASQIASDYLVDLNSDMRGCA